LIEIFQVMLKIYCHFFMIHRVYRRMHKLTINHTITHFKNFNNRKFEVLNFH